MKDLLLCTVFMHHKKVCYVDFNMLHANIKDASHKNAKISTSLHHLYVPFLISETENLSRVALFSNALKSVGDRPSAKEALQSTASCSSAEARTPTRGGGGGG